MIAAFSVCAVLSMGCPPPESPTPAQPAQVADLPRDYQEAEQTAATVCPGLDWTVLAGLSSVETDHGREADTGVSSGENEAGAAGPVQFLQPTFDEIKQAHPDVTGNRYDLRSETRAAAYYLCESGADRGDLRKALYAYNHSSRYVDEVLRRSDFYRSASQPPPPPPVLPLWRPY